MNQHRDASLTGKVHHGRAPWVQAMQWAIALGMLVLAMGPAMMAQTKNASAKPAPKSTAGAKAAELGAPHKSYGSANAPITMEVFSDYQCPSCRELYERTLRPMIDDYVASGKVYLIHHDFALSGHQYSGQAARWATAASRVGQGQFATVEAALFDNQAAWAADGNIEKYIAAALSSADFARVQHAMQACEPPGPTAGLNGGVNVPPKPCSMDGYIADDIMLGLKIPVHATPTYVISYKGTRLPASSGVVTWPILKQFFDSLVSR